MLKTLFFTSIFFALPTLAKNLPKASFDCTKASAPIEKKICGSERLAALDLLLSQVYKMALTKPSADATKAEQKAWLKQRNECVDQLPADEDQCLNESYKQRIQDLQGTDELIKFYRADCAKEDWSCSELGDLELKLNRYQDVVTDLTESCKADHDGEMGTTCYQKAVGLEHTGKKTEALAQMTATCKDHQHNEACAAAYRLAGKKSSNPWVGLYRNDTGTLFVNDTGDNQVSVNADTHWANGHYCGWTKKGKISGSKLIVDPDPDSPDCKPTIEKLGTKIKVQDPDMACKNSYCGARALFSGEFDLDAKSSP